MYKLRPERQYTRSKAAASTSRADDAATPEEREKLMARLQRQKSLLEGFAAGTELESRADLVEGPGRASTRERGSSAAGGGTVLDC